MMEKAAEDLIAAARSPETPDEQLRASAGRLLDAAADAPVAAVNDAMRRLARCIDMRQHQRSAFVALVCGALVESGHDPEIVSGGLLGRLHSLLVDCAEFADKCRAVMPEVAEDQDEGEIFESARKQVSLQLPEQHSAWEALNIFWRPAIAVLSVSAVARAAARP